MDQRLTVLTIGARDLAAMRTFYEISLGWVPVAGNEDVVFYKLNGFLFSLVKKRELENFIGTNLGDGHSVTFGYNVRTEAEVQLIFEDLKNKGVKILKEPTVPPFGGLFFYFQDVEGNILEVAYNAFIPLDKDNNAMGHQSIDNL